MKILNTKVLSTNLLDCNELRVDLFIQEADKRVNNCIYYTKCYFKFLMKLESKVQTNCDLIYLKKMF